MMTSDSSKPPALGPLLQAIQSPDDVKKIADAELPNLAEEIRHSLITSLSQTGGHLGPNLGVVELSIALHRVFSTPKDKFVFDVAHQGYVHKMLTGRWATLACPTVFRAAALGLALNSLLTLVDMTTLSLYKPFLYAETTKLNTQIRVLHC